MVPATLEKGNPSFGWEVVNNSWKPNTFDTPPLVSERCNPFQDGRLVACHIKNKRNRLAEAKTILKLSTESLSLCLPLRNIE